MLVADQTTPYRLLTEVIYSCGQAGYAQLPSAGPESQGRLAAAPREARDVQVATGHVSAYASRPLRGSRLYFAGGLV